MLRGKMTGFWAVAVCMLVFGAGTANAAFITIEIEAVVDYVEDQGPGDGYLEGMIGLGDIITGFYTYDTSTPDTNPSLYVADYVHHAPPCGISLTVGGFEFKTDPTNMDFSLEIINDYTSGGLHDSYGVLSGGNLALSNGSPVDGIFWWLRDSSATALPSTDLPTTAPVLGDWQSNILMFGADRLYGITAHVTYAIPEPASLLLFVGGALLLRKRW